MSKIGIVIQVRTGSTRLPNKVVLPFYKEKGILELMLMKMKSLGDKYQLIISTTTEKGDDAIVEIALNNDIPFYRGNEKDVLSRFIDTAQAYELNTIVRVCADNPFLDTESIIKLIDVFNSKENLDYCSYKDSKGTPVIKTHIGIFAEIVTLDALKKAYGLTNDDFYKEHVTNYLYLNPDKFNIHLENSFEEVHYREDLRFTVDDAEDFDNLSFLFDYYYHNQYDIKKLIKFVDANVDRKEVMINNIKKYNK